MDRPSGERAQAMLVSMQREERLAVAATVGLALAGLGAFLPWARIGGRSRSGFNTADTFIGLADGALPDALAWVGRWWYAPALLLLIAWATMFLAGSLAVRTIGPLLVTVSGAMWWLFVWSADNWNVLDVRLTGPVVASVGLVVIAGATAQRRASLLASNAGSRPASADRV